MKTNFAVLLVFLFSLGLKAQSAEPRKIDIGLFVSLDQNQTEYTLSDWVFQGIDEINKLEAEAGIGFSIGLSTEIRISDKASLRFSPVASFQNNQLIFTDKEEMELSIDIHPRSLGFPLHFIYAPRGRSKIPYFFIGPRVNTQIGEIFDPTIFSISKTNIAAEFGLGITVLSKVFTISPQLSFSQGLSNLKSVGESGLYNNAVRNITSNRLSLGVIVGLVKK